jgi:hypothetical protein
LGFAYVFQVNHEFPPLIARFRLKKLNHC